MPLFQSPKPQQKENLDIIRRWISYLLLLPDMQQRKRESIYSGSQCEGMQSLMPPRSIKGLVSLCPQEKAENRQTGREADDKTQRPALSPCNSNLPPQWGSTCGVPQPSRTASLLGDQCSNPWAGGGGGQDTSHSSHNKMTRKAKQVTSEVSCFCVDRVV